MNSKIVSWIARRLLIYFAFWIWGFLLLEVSAGCPKVCQCKWKGGKQWVSCSSANFIDIPKGLEPSTQVLNLEHNSLKILIRDAFVDRGLVNLQKVFLNFCNLRKLEKGAFRKLANLVELDLSNNLLTFLPVDALSDVPDLRELKVRNNSISYIASDAFRRTSELVQLDLAYNKIKVIGERAFAFLNKLEILDLSGNNLHTLTMQIFQPLDSLHGFYVHANPWNCNCFLRPLRQWMVERNIAASVPPSCFRPERLRDRLWDSLELNEFVCVPHVTPVAQRVLAAHGDNVSLACRVETDDEASVTWLIGDKAVAKGDFAVEPRYRVLELLVPDRGNASRVSNLTISGADLQDQGIYRCVVENKAGRVETNLTLKVSEVISEDPLVEIDQVFVAGALLGGLAFVIFAIFIACAIFYKRKRRHAQNIARINSELLEEANACKIANKSEQFQMDNHPEFAEYQILPTSDNDPELSDYKTIRNITEPINPNIKCSDYYNRVSESDISNKVRSDVHMQNYNVSSINKPNPVEFGTPKPSLGAAEPLLQDLAQQCKNEALKRQKLYKDTGNVFGLQSSVRYPDLLTSQTSDFRYCTIPRGLRQQRPLDNLSDLKLTDGTAETSFSSVGEPTSRSSGISLPQKENHSYRRTPSLPSTPLQTHIPPGWGKLMNEEDSGSFSLQPFDYQFHASQLEHFLQEYKSLQEELYRMKETAVEAPDEERKTKITTRPTLDTEGNWREQASYSDVESLPQSSTERARDITSYATGEPNLKSILKRKDNLHRHSLSRDFVYDS